MKQKSEPIAEGKLNEMKVIVTKRPNGTLRIQKDFQYCPTMTEQHTSHMTDLNYLMAKYKPDELAAYIAAKNQARQEIIGHDFSSEPNLQEAKNSVYQLQKNFEALDPEIKQHFRNHIDFLKFIDNPANAEKMLKLGLMTKREIKDNTTPTTTTTTQEEKAETKA